MSLEVRPLGVKCNIQCEYCYQDPQRVPGVQTKGYDLSKIKQAVLNEGGPFTLFGGEPLLIPFRDLAELVEWGWKKFGVTYIQSNGSLLTQRHIDLFKRYNVRVGLSLDGPDELNDVRRSGDLARTRKMTERSQAALESLCQQGMRPSVIVTLHRGNASRDRIPRLLKWLLDLDGLGIRNVRLHLLEVDDERIRNTYALSDSENVAALAAIASFQPRFEHLTFDTFSDMYQLLSASPVGTTCVWNACDPYSTPAVRGIEGQGQRSNCGRTNKDGIDFIKSSDEGFERYIALYQTPQADGGCAGCRFFLMCKGQCPGTAIDGDWRNRTEQCATWFQLFSALELEMEVAGEHPVSRHPLLREAEQLVVKGWTEARNTPLVDAFAALGPGDD